MGLTRKIKCQHCNRLFVPDPRNAGRQLYCELAECRKASKAASQQRWLQKEENMNYFRGPINCRRVRAWRQAHPGYWRRAKADPVALQDPLIEQAVDIKRNTPKLEKDPLQDLLIMHPNVIIGLIANLTGSALQDDIAFSVRRLQQLGRDILNPHKGADDDCQASTYCPPGTQSAPAVQLGRSAPGA
jgi:hypothetical protein